MPVGDTPARTPGGTVPVASVQGAADPSTGVTPRRMQPISLGPQGLDGQTAQESARQSSRAKLPGHPGGNFDLRLVATPRIQAKSLRHLAAMILAEPIPARLLNLLKQLADAAANPQRGKIPEE